MVTEIGVAKKQEEKKERIGGERSKVRRETDVNLVLLRIIVL